MHRKTTATLLVTMAASALTGCVTVHRPPAPAPPPTAPSAPWAGRPDGSVDPRPVQAPAREALGRVPSAPGLSPSGTAPDRAPRPEHRVIPPVAPPAPASPRSPQHRHSHPHRHPHRPRSGQQAQVPPAVSGPLPRNADVCALGRRYGKWRPDSPESAICDGTYGR
ncbi:hypothetical protein CP978_06280 [Streptomyces nodosus]|uniref:Lipoprotein n=1 Tax=Streptomyces nodosus TaxID=40318 RepID=A0A5P2W4B9_9ACTN|nr:hypothetical protein [Streptomyces nodosus]QEV38199.1 hypothetical protein CP978_06280 [Streptomyces nodosus]